jgi:hypothetical protein
VMKSSLDLTPILSNGEGEKASVKNAELNVIFIFYNFHLTIYLFDHFF